MDRQNPSFAAQMLEKLRHAALSAWRKNYKRGDSYFFPRRKIPGDQAY
jgi:hypothetical protein